MIKKFFTLLCLCTLCIGSAWGTTKTITLENLGSSLSSIYNSTVSTVEITATGTSDAYTLNYLQGKKQDKSIILAHSKGAFISNKTPIPGNIKSITVYINSGASGKTTYHCAFSSTECTSAYTTGSTAVNIIGGKSNNFNCSLSDAKYFCISLGNAYNGQVLNIVIEYESATPTSAYTVTFDAGTNGSCSTTELTEASAGAGVTLPSCTANDGYVFKGWSTTENGTTPNAGKAGETYKPSSNCILYAVYAKTYVLTITQPEAGGILTVKNGDTELKTEETVEVGTKLTCEVTDIPKGKSFNQFNAKYDGGSRYRTSNPATFDNIPENISALEIDVEYTDLAQYTINYMVNGVNTDAQENVYEGTALAFPKVSDIGNKVFVGWAEKTINGTTNTKPTLVNTVNQTASKTVTYYAVFATKGEGEDKYVKVTSTSDLTDGLYLIVYETGEVALHGALTEDQASNTVSVTISNGEITPTIAINAAAVTFNATDGSFLGGGGKYIGHTGTSNTLNYNNSPLANVVTFDNGDAVITAGDYVMRYNNSKDQNRFRYYKSGQQAIQLYKKHEIAYSDYCTDVSYTRTVNTANIGTLCVPYAFEKPDYLTLYNIVGKADGKIYFEENEDEIEAGKPYLFRSTEENITLTYTGEKAAEAKTNNGLVGTFEGCEIASKDGNYILSGNKLYFVDGDFNCGANRAYIHIGSVSDYNPSTAKADFTLDFNEPTGINTIDNGQWTMDNSKAYNLNGVRVNEAYKGIVIMNGKKYINK